MMPFQTPLQRLVSTPGPIILINSILTGALAGILVASIFSTDFDTNVISALLTLVIAFSMDMVYANRIWKKAAQKNLEVRFPSPKK